MDRSGREGADDGDVPYNGGSACSCRREGARGTSRRPRPNGADGGGSASDDVLMELSSKPTTSDLGSDDEQRGCGSRGDSERVREERETASWCGPTRWGCLMTRCARICKKNLQPSSINAPRQVLHMWRSKHSWQRLTRPSQQIRSSNRIYGPK